MSTKERLDILVARRGHAESREQAQRVILTGRVTVNGQVATKAGHRFSEDCKIVVEAGAQFVGRGGDKLQAAFDAFGLDVDGHVCLDVGASTGGFTDCLLQHGASKVITVDVGKGQLHWKLRNDPRVVVMEKVNARYLKKSDLADEPVFACCDVSFISLTKVLPAVIEVLAESGEIVTLIKPQFEAGREKVEKGGVVRDPEVRLAVVNEIKRFGTEELGLDCLGDCESPLIGPAGNVEFLAYWRKGTS